MKNITFITLFILIVKVTYPVTIPDSILKKCNTAENIVVLSKNEKDVILYINMARCFPQYFYDSILYSYMEANKTNKKTKFYKTLKTDLYNTKSLTPLIFNETLYQMTKAFAKDMGKRGKIGHTDSKGGSFEKRTENFGYCGENCSYGYENAMDIVLQLLLDEGVPSLGHRKNILNPNYHIIAASIHKHKKLDWNCVVDFAA